MPPPCHTTTGQGNGSASRRRRKKKNPVAPAGPGLQIRQVWADNVEREFKLIRAAVEHFPYVSMDTEFPGVVHHHPTKHHAALTPTERYALVKANVDALHLIQVGLAFAASPSSPPALAFEINLREFDPRAHRHAPDSLRLLADSGVDFAANRARGVPATALAALMVSSGLVCNNHQGGGGGVTWVAFSSAYDFAYLVKLLTGRKLPRSMPDFLRHVRAFFGDRVYDVKHVMTRCAGLYGGLDRVAAALGVHRAAGRSHQAGSDSVLTWDTFRRIRQLYFPKEGAIQSFAGVLFGLEGAHAGAGAVAAPPRRASFAPIPCVVAASST
jgi:CCR4-NOT transcription complex subunit 7/8